MQNWNQWQQVPTVSAPGPVPQPPSAPGYPAAGGADPMATMQAYMQYYNQPVSIIIIIFIFSKVYEDKRKISLHQMVHYICYEK